MKNYFILFFISFCASNTAAQDPNWTINSANYQYSMTFTTFLNVNGTTLSSADDEVAAFVNGEIRGFAKVTKVASANKFVAYLTVFANKNTETINFKIYDSTTDTIIDIAETATFKIDGNVGGIFQSYSIAKPALSNDAVLNSLAFSGITNISESVVNDKVSIVLPFGTNLSNLKAVFNVSDGALFFVAGTKQISGVTTQDFTNEVGYELLSENQAKLISYKINVTIANQSSVAPIIVLKTDSKAFVKHAPIIIKMESNTAVSDFTVEDVLAKNAIVSSITKESELLYALQIVPIQQGEFSIQIPENVVLNAENKGNLVSNKLSFSYDLVNPYLLFIKRKNPTEEITDHDTLEFMVSFNEPVENVLVTDFESISDAVLTLLKVNDSIYTVTISNIESYFGVLDLSIKSSNTIKDKAGNLLLNSVIKIAQN